MTDPSDVPEVDVHEAKRRTEAGARLVDVREPYEHRNVRIPGAQLLPLSELTTRFRDELEDGPLVIYCRSGARSGRVVQFLLQQGYDAVNVDGGILAWEEEGLPVERGGD